MSEANEALAYSMSRAVPSWTTDAETHAIRLEHERRQELVEIWRENERYEQEQRRASVVSWLVVAALVGLFAVLALLGWAR